MYAVLGNTEAQKEIRERSPESTHCDLLLINPNACSNCKKNPHHRNKQREETQKDVREFDLMDDEIQAIYRIVSMYDYDMMTKLDEISPAEALCLRILDAYKKQQNQVRGLLSSILGGGNK